MLRIPANYTSILGGGNLRLGGASSTIPCYETLHTSRTGFSGVVTFLRLQILRLFAFLIVMISTLCNVITYIIFIIIL